MTSRDRTPADAWLVVTLPACAAVRDDGDVESIFGCSPGALVESPHLWLRAIGPRDRGRLRAALTGLGNSRVHRAAYTLTSAARRAVIRAWNVDPVLEHAAVALTVSDGASTAGAHAVAREVSHRVKNNLQIVTSMLRLQLDTLPDPGLHRVVDAACSRVRAIAAAYDLADGSSSRVRARTYVRTLVRAALGGAEAERASLEVADLRLDLDAAIRWGIILNELLTNAMAHGRGPVAVRLRAAAGQLVLRVTDKGRGAAPARSPGKATLGLPLVRHLATEAGGTLRISRREGYEVRVAMPRPVLGQPGIR